MQFEHAYNGWKQKRLTQEDAARLLNVYPRTFRRYLCRYEENGMDGLIDKRLGQVSQRRAPVDEVMALESLYRDRYDSWNVKHFHKRYQSHHQGERSYIWVKSRLQAAGLVPCGKRNLKALMLICRKSPRCLQYFMRKYYYEHAQRPSLNAF